MIRILCTIVFLAVAASAQAETLTLASTYDEVGTNPDGSKYTGTVSVKVISDTTFLIEWKIGNSTYKGFGMRLNETLAATYTIDGDPGLAMYKVDDDGTLDGIWTVRGKNESGTDRLTPRN
ncbi:MAG: hypothetical protein ABSC37_03565 [Xanthobacteraceae bacterium]